MEIVELPPAEIAKLREKVKPVIDKHAAVGEDIVKEVNAEIAKVRAQEVTATRNSATSTGTTARSAR